MNGLKLASVVVALALMASGCVKEPPYPVEPVISFERFEQTPTSAKLTLSFTDGDGDVGLDASDQQPPFDEGSEYYHNLFLIYEELHNGVWVRPDLELENNFRIPRITPTGQNKVLQGEIDVDLFWPLNDPNSPFDTVRFEVRMYDRALHQSNVIHTDPIKVVP